MILLGYDGSADAQSAIDHAGTLLSGQPATVLTVWEPFVAVMSRAGAGFDFAGGIVDVDGIDTASEQSAQARAAEGAERARRVGLDAQPRVTARRTSIASTILDEADEVGATAIVLGTRGLTGLKAVLLGSVSHGVLQHTDRPVIVIPSPETAAARAAARR